MEMQRLCTGMMERYEIENRRPSAVNAVQFGMGEALLATVDRRIDDYNAKSDAGNRIGIACVQAGETGHAQRLAAQDGMYTLLVRGYADEEAVTREQVVQCILQAVDPEAEPDALGTLAAAPDIVLALVDDTPAAQALASRFLALRQAAGRAAVPLFYLGEPVGDWGDGAFPMLADSLAFRAEADEAARQCAEMNYLDEMLHIAEPHARLTLVAPEELPRRFPLDRAPDVHFVDSTEMVSARRLQAQVFDAGLFLMAAAGWLNGCDTLRDCMTHERLRRFVGEAFTGELLPALSDVDRQALERCVIESFARYENPLNRNRILRCAEGLLGRFARGPLAALRRLSETNFEPPRRLSFALAATVMLYAGARRNPETGCYEVARGKELQVLRDDPEKLAVFAALSHDMPPESLAYAALADRELWDGLDLRDIDGLLERVTLDLAAMQRQPGFLPTQEDAVPPSPLFKESIP